MLQVRKLQLLAIPPTLETVFMNSVMGSYFDRDLLDQHDILTDIHICDEIMVGILSHTASLEIFEDEYYYEKLKEDSPLFEQFEDCIADKTDEFHRDVFMTLRHHNLSFKFDYNNTFHNLPNKEVW